ncbi:hypothetical protein MP228_001508 [Amoeboaphelidium protococcarum]|nr:hypothetical protein MP228_001508 [Amoeboaphelidium protococcarum]
MDSVEISKEDINQFYTLQEVLGKGSYGEVNKGIEKQTGAVVAIKCISIDRTSSTDIACMNSIMKEIAILKDCSHRNIVRYYNSFINLGADVLFIVMEYCGAGSVRDLFAAMEQPLEERFIAVICRETVQGLSYLHSNGKIHRDIKCGNILLCEDGQVKLADFGVSAQLEGSLGKRNTFCGSPFWMCPQLIQETGYDGKADIWSLGITLIEMAEMVPPHSQVHPMRVLFKILREPPPRLAEKDKWSALFHDVISKTLVKSDKERFTAEELLQHPFCQQASHTSILVDLIEQSRVAASQLKSASKSASGDDGGSSDEVNDAGGTLKKQQLKQNALTMYSTISKLGTFKVNESVASGFNENGTMRISYDTTVQSNDGGTMKSKKSWENIHKQNTLSGANTVLHRTPSPPMPLQYGTVKKAPTTTGRLSRVQKSDDVVSRLYNQNATVQLPVIQNIDLNAILEKPGDGNYLSEALRNITQEQDIDIKCLPLMTNILRLHKRQVEINQQLLEPPPHFIRKAQEYEVIIRSVYKI